MRIFFVEHIELDLCVKFQVNQTYGERGVAFPKTHFQALITAPPSGSWNWSSSGRQQIITKPRPLQRYIGPWRPCFLTNLAHL